MGRKGTARTFPFGAKRNVVTAELGESTVASLWWPARSAGTGGRGRGGGPRTDSPSPQCRWGRQVTQAEALGRCRRDPL